MNTNHFFWTWFLDNHHHLRDLRQLSPKMQKHYTFWLNWHLHYYSSGLDYLLVFPKRKNKEMQMIITANGDPEYFEKVESIISEAPRIKSWKFTAFIQPSSDYDEMEQGLDKPYIFQDITLKTSDLKFTPFEEEGDKKIDMIVHLKNFTVFTDSDKVLQLVYILLQDLLGEKMLYQNINFVQLAEMPEDNRDLIQLYDLQYYLDELNRS